MKIFIHTRRYLQLFSTLYFSLPIITPNSLLLGASPLRPQSVSQQAVYFSKFSIWMLEQNRQRKIWYKNGILKASGPYTQKQRNGLWIFYHPNGYTKGIGVYKNGKKNGSWKLYHASNYLEAKGTYTNNLREGLWYFYNRNQKLYAKGNYRSGRKDGLWQGYYDSGKTFYIGYYQKGRTRGHWKYYYKNSSLFQEGELNNGLRVGVWTICIYPGWSCSKQTYHKFSVPPPAHLKRIYKKKPK